MESLRVALKVVAGSVLSVETPPAAPTLDSSVEDDVQWRDADSLIIHKRYLVATSPKYDISLIVVDRDFTLNHFVYPVGFATKDANYAGTCQISGYAVPPVNPDDDKNSENDFIRKKRYASDTKNTPRDVEPQYDSIVSESLFSSPSDEFGPVPPPLGDAVASSLPLGDSLTSPTTQADIVASLYTLVDSATSPRTLGDSATYPPTLEEVNSPTTLKYTVTPPPHFALDAIHTAPNPEEYATPPASLGDVDVSLFHPNISLLEDKNTGNSEDDKKLLRSEITLRTLNQCRTEMDTNNMMHDEGHTKYSNIPERGMAKQRPNSLFYVSALICIDSKHEKDSVVRDAGGPLVCFNTDDSAENAQFGAVTPVSLNRRSNSPPKSYAKDGIENFIALFDIESERPRFRSKKSDLKKLGVLVGIASGAKKNMVFYTRLSKYKNWIEKTNRATCLEGNLIYYFILAIVLYFAT